MYYSRVRARIEREERVSLEHVNELLFFNPARRQRARKRTHLNHQTRAYDARHVHEKQHYVQHPRRAVLCAKKDARRRTKSVSQKHKCSGAARQRRRVSRRDDARMTKTYRSERTRGQT
jgi:hypothetical protein